MNRKLHNTVTALFATSGLLALSLVASRPLPPPVVAQAFPAAAQVARAEALARRIEVDAAVIEQRLSTDSEAIAELAGLSARAATLAAVAEAIDPAATDNGDAAPAHPVRRSHRGRQSVAMPFFSFFPKG